MGFLLKVSKFQNEFMKSSFLTKYEPKIVRISVLTIFGRNNDFICNPTKPLKYETII